MINGADTLLLRSLFIFVAAFALISPTSAEPLKVYASHAVLADFAKIIGGEDVVVTMPVPEGTDPAEWRPRIAEINAFQEADLVLLNGAEYEGWAERASLPRARTVHTTRGMEAELIRLVGSAHSHGNDPAHTHEGIAPHVWMDFSLAAKQAEVISAALKRAAPGAAPSFTVNLTVLQAELAALDAEAKALGAAVTGPTVLVWQPGYEYFGRAYGLTLVETTFDAMAQATPEQLAAFDATLAETDAQIMLWQSPPPAETAAAIAERGVSIVVFDNGANPPADIRFPDLMRENLARFRAALDQP